MTPEAKGAISPREGRDLALKDLAFTVQPLIGFPSGLSNMQPSSRPAWLCIVPSTVRKASEV